MFSSKQKEHRLLHRPDIGVSEFIAVLVVQDRQRERSRRRNPLTSTGSPSFSNATSDNRRSSSNLRLRILGSITAKESACLIRIMVTPRPPRGDLALVQNRVLRRGWDGGMP